MRHYIFFNAKGEPRLEEHETPEAAEAKAKGAREKLGPSGATREKGEQLLKHYQDLRAAKGS